MLKSRLACAALLQLVAFSVQSQDRHALQTHMSAPAGAAMMGASPAHSV